MPKRTLLRLVAALAGLLVLLAGLTAVRLHQYGKLTPPGDTFSEYLATMPEPRDYRLVSVNGQEYLVVRGTARVWSFPSGDPIYLFDKTGTLADWTHDGGDAEAFHARWPGVYSGRQLTREQAVGWVTRLAR